MADENKWSYVDWHKACERHREHPDDEWWESAPEGWVPWDGVSARAFLTYRHRTRVKAPLDFRGAMRAMLEGKVVEGQDGWRYRIDDHGLRGKAPKGAWHGVFSPCGVLAPFTVVDPERLDVSPLDALRTHAEHPDDEWEVTAATDGEDGWIPWSGWAVYLSHRYRRRPRA